MNLNQSMPLTTFAVLLAGVLAICGCADDAGGPSEIIRGKVGTLPFPTAESRSAVSELNDEILRLLHGASASRKKAMLDDLGKCFRDIAFDESSYSARERAMSDYYQVVSGLSRRLLELEGAQDAVWRFKLLALDRVNQEIHRCESEPTGGIYGDIPAGSGTFMTQRQYLAHLRAKRFEFVRMGFECGAFTMYYKSLPEGERREWVERIGRTAHRKVVVWDPDNQLIEMPRYIPDDDRMGVRFSENGRPCGYVEPIGGGKVMKMTIRGQNEYGEELLR